jgi:hypothetical protein
MAVCSIKITNPDNKAVWEKQVTEQEYHKVRTTCLSNRVAGIIWSSVFPIRTNNWSNFSKDFFIPNVVHYATKTDAVFRKVVEHIVFFFVDLMTLPIRALTCIPRILYNSLQPDCPLVVYLKKEGVDRRLLQTDCLQVDMHADFRPNLSEYEYTVSGKRHFIEYEEFSQKVYAVDIPYALRRGPGYLVFPAKGANDYV